MNRVKGFSTDGEPLVEPSKKPHIGGTLILTCVSSSAHERCIWKHNSNVCQFDWDRRHRNVQNQHCKAYGKRLTFHGIYPAHECKMQLTNINKSDSGKWTCEMVHKKNKIFQDIYIEVMPLPPHPQKRMTEQEDVSKNTEVSKGKISNVTIKTASSIPPTKSTTQASLSNSSLETIKKEDVSDNRTNRSGDIKLIL